MTNMKIWTHFEPWEYDMQNAALKATIMFVMEIICATIPISNLLGSNLKHSSSA